MAEANPAAVLVARGLTKSYGNHPAVRDLDLDVPPGRVVGLVGDNGAGKTTALKMLAGLLEPTQGQALFEGEPTLQPKVRKSIGYLPEESPLYDDMTAMAYLQFFGGLYDLPRRVSRQHAETLLRRLALEPPAWSRRIGTLSKGMRRKIAIARCLLHEPRLLILDEPTSGLDPFTTAEVETLMRELRREGKAIVLSAHHLRQVEALCDDILVLHEGRVVRQGSLADLGRTIGQLRFLLRATVAFDGSRPDGAHHSGVFERFEDVQRALEAIHVAGGIVLAVESLAPSLQEMLRRESEAPHG